MSGGPVFDEHGHLVGLVCSSFATDSGDGPAYVSLVWPALIAPFLGGWPAGLVQGPTTLLTMSDAHCTIIGRQYLRKVKDPVSGEAQHVVEDWDFAPD